uniref:SWIM-type domain-containing protein n=1 Tax=Amphimedon queenslandica TaxID=400682 RepID=A0A1X7TMG7_AMPQE
MKQYSSSADQYEIADGWVDNISLWPPIEYVVMFKLLYFCYEYNPTVCALKSKVRTSQGETVLHLAWVALNKSDGRIITGHCKRMAGSGEVCSHIAAILFKVKVCIRLKIADYFTDRQMQVLLLTLI